MEKVNHIQQRLGKTVTELREIYLEKKFWKQNDSGGIFEVSASAGLVMLGIFKQAKVHSQGGITHGRDQESRKPGGRAAHCPRKQLFPGE